LNGGGFEPVINQIETAEKLAGRMRNKGRGRKSIRPNAKEGLTC
jgi:hypothetical protein